MPRAAVLGSPIAHSLSPVLHRAAYAALGLDDWSYGAIECDEVGLPALLAGLGPEWAGLSLTMPLKRVALDLADEVSELARAVGAVNTLLLGGASGRGRHADNTDVGGMVDALREAGVTRPRSALVLGAGGTARAALAALRELGLAEAAVAARNPARATDLEAAALRLGVEVAVFPWSSAPLAGWVDLVISTVPAGAADSLAAMNFSPSVTVLDVVYDPWPTRFAAAAEAGGARVVGGHALLLYQAARQVETMTGQVAPVEAMRAALHARIAVN